MSISIRDKWDDLSSDVRNTIQKVVIGCILIGILTASYYASGRDEVKAPIVEEKREISIGADLLEDDIRAKVNQDLDIERQVNTDQAKRLEALEIVLGELKNGQ